MGDNNTDRPGGYEGRKDNEMYRGAEVGYFNDNSQYIIQMNKNGRYDARRFWSVNRDDAEEDMIVENVTYTEAAAAVTAMGYEISESLI